MRLKAEPLASMCEAIVDCPHSTPVWTNSGFVVLRNQNIKGGRLDLSSPSYTDEEHFKQRVRRMAPRAGDIVITREAPMGDVCKIPEGLICCLGQRQVLLRPKAGVNPDYLLYALQSPSVQDQIRWNEGTGSTVSNIRIPVLEKIEIPRLGQAEESIAATLKSVDDKIDVNRRINQTLEAMALAIFKSWFVDFDPVKAKIAAKAEGQDPLRAAMRAISGKPYDELDALPPEQYEQLATTALLFPDEIDESAVMDIPKGWTVQSADSLTEVGIGKTPPRKEPQWFTEGQGEWRWVSIRDMGASGVFQQRASEYLTSEAVVRFNVRVVPDRTVLLSFKLTIGRVAITDGPMLTNEAIAHFKLPSETAVSSEYLYLYLKGFDFSTLGSTSSIADAVNSKTIREMPITVASRDLIDKFTKSVTPLFEEMRNRQNEISSLGATRDALLPKLLSGEIEVPA
ncbi:type I restriction enzyme, S subunit [Pseudomonas sp. NFACC24-1]|uniref:restriction endonuclease subunit S n=1 Tax=Pseudomonas sp. NFACC24-1 TaxID=1566189 RepID=UPI0008E226F2|nr:restriction endonuclease subunit S [Pseudomonas sp. NFACC24-1]SFO83240.1 type I restriction enzyme, S subunit [Pseudomonas sp. NFACC24-1]